MIKKEKKDQRASIVLCLSGGGFRATLFHLGGIRRLHELDILPKIDRIVGVSGGSILAAALAKAWPLTDFEALSSSVRAFCQKDLRTKVLLWERMNPKNWRFLLKPFVSVTDLLGREYDDGLSLNRMKLMDLPVDPEFVFCATNMKTGTNWEFRRKEMGDWMSGFVPTGNFRVSQAIAASSAYPLVFPPLCFRTQEFKRGKAIMRVPKSPVYLGDGGIYDNLGLEPAWKGAKNGAARTVLVSDAGHPFEQKRNPGVRIYRRIPRSFSITLNQSGSIRKRWFIAMLKKDILSGTYWGITSNYKTYDLRSARGYPERVRERLATIRTDLNSFAPGESACIENHGYALADAAVRKWINPDLWKKADFSYPHPEYAEPAAAIQALRQSDRASIFADILKSLRGIITG